MGKNQKIIKTDVVVAGGGPAGCVMAALLAIQGFNVTCVDQENPIKTSQQLFDERTTAISYGSHLILKDIGVWDSLLKEACPIKDIQIMDSGSPVLLNFLAKDAQEDAFGWIVTNKILKEILYKKIGSLKHCTHITSAKIIDFEQTDGGITTHLQSGQKIESKLVIGADGRKSFTRTFMGIETRGWNYNQSAFVFIVSHENPHNNIAVEDFRSDGPFAILPMKNSPDGQHQSAVVWTLPSSQKNSIETKDVLTFNAAIRERMPDFYGKTAIKGTIASYPLNLSHAQSYISPRMALIADAAHGIHPIAGQGLNLGLRDARVLCDILTAAKEQKNDLGDFALLQAYERTRRPDILLMVAATDGLNKLFSNDLSSVRILRKMGLKIVQKLPRVRRFFMNQAMGKSII